MAGRKESFLGSASLGRVRSTTAVCYLLELEHPECWSSALETSVHSVALGPIPLSTEPVCHNRMARYLGFSSIVRRD